jgi:plasmid stabilization system protein ParE
MARIALTPELADDFERILDHLLAHQSQNATTVIESIVEAIGILESNPRIGRMTSGGKRELIIGASRTGHVALYRFIEEADLVVVIGIRAQREAGYAR